LAGKFKFWREYQKVEKIGGKLNFWGNFEKVENLAGKMKREHLRSAVQKSVLIEN
jgi:hypothetical protein